MAENVDAGDIRKRPHHDRDELCATRPSYRQGRKLTAVKVYTINEESQHIIIRGVPALNLHRELKHLCMRYGEVKLVHAVANYAEDEEAFTEVYHAHFGRIQSARFAKHMIDDKAFFGGVLHVCYAPELESISETRNKLAQRKRDVLKRVQRTATTQRHLAEMVKLDSHAIVSPQVPASITLADGGVTEQVFVPRSRTRNHTAREAQTHPRAPAILANLREHTSASTSTKRNYATMLLPSSLKKCRVDPQS